MPTERPRKKAECAALKLMFQNPYQFGCMHGIFVPASQNLLENSPIFDERILTSELIYKTLATMAKAEFKKMMRGELPYNDVIRQAAIFVIAGRYVRIGMTFIVFDGKLDDDATAERIGFVARQLNQPWN